MLLDAPHPGRSVFGADQYRAGQEEKLVNEAWVKAHGPVLAAMAEAIVERGAARGDVDAARSAAARGPKYG